MIKSITPARGTNQRAPMPPSMSTHTKTYLVKDFITQFSENRYYIDKSFQRNLVWTKKQMSKYIQSLVNGTASSNMISADIRSAIPAANLRGETHEEQILRELDARGYTSVSLDGMQRRKCILDFYHNKVSLDFVITDLNGVKHVCRGKYFKDLHADAQTAFLYSSCHMCSHMDTPYSEFPGIFVGINDGAGLNAQEHRVPIRTPVSQIIRTLAESTYQDVWPAIEGMSDDKIKRMADSELLLHMFMELLPGIVEKDFISKEHCDNFYYKGEGKRDINHVPEYSGFDRAKEIIKMTMECFRQQRDCKKVAKKTVWAVLFVCREVYDLGLVVHNYEELFRVARESDNQLNAKSKMQQGKDITSTMKKTGCTEEDAANLHPDDNYYWRWVNRHGAAKYRNKRIVDLLPVVKKHISLFAITRAQNRKNA